jgi:hypothetical protein
MRPRYQGGALSGLLSWTQDDLALHLNLGRDFVHGGADQDGQRLGGMDARLVDHG